MRDVPQLSTALPVHSKHTLRLQMRACRAALSPQENAAFSALIAARLREVTSQTDAPAVAVYLATSEEANLDEFINWLLANGQDVYAPHTSGFALLKSLKLVNMGKFKVREPQGALVQVPHTTIFLVPGLAFDRFGGRLGFGGGWYDRALARFPQALKIGIAFDCQIVDEVPREPHDVKMDLVISPSACLKCTMQN